ncbi:hypothetical protein F4X86_04375 [Candidatus Saccharibacteria bacterium]|nr:hypothetical protein [Candidatus Saccharibacteria bacterium]
MARVAKKPQYEAFNRRRNCFGRFQVHSSSLSNWRRPALPLMLEVGAGSAVVSLQFSLDNPDWQVLAVDRKSDRLNKAAGGAPRNLAFLQTDLDDLAEHIDLTGQVDLLWLAFPDPYPTKRRAKHRLTHPRRLDLYRRLLAPAGRLRLKTDDQGLFAYSCGVFSDDPDFEIVGLREDLAVSGYETLPAEARAITRYEATWLELGLPINYLEVISAGGFDNMEA